jgi:F420-0:gamma-glutamyl ligase
MLCCRDLYGKLKYGGVDIVAHEVCSAATLVQTAGGVPEAVIKGLRYRERGLKDSLPRANLGEGDGGGSQGGLESCGRALSSAFF